MDNTQITFLGLGIMGSRMAQNLLKNGQSVTVWNRSIASAQRLESLGAKSSSSVAEAVVDADFVFTMLAHPEAVSAVMLQEHGGLHHMKKDAVWIDCSTVNPSFSQTCAKEARQVGVGFMDAPVAGSLPHAERAELSFFVGGNDTDIQTVAPFLEMMGKNILPFEQVGQGAAYKMLINSMLAQSMVTFSETVLLGERMGLDRQFLLESLPKSPVAPAVTGMKAANISKQEYFTMFPLEWMHKDLRLVAQCAEEKQLSIPMAQAARAAYAEAMESGWSRADFAAVFESMAGNRAMP